MFTAVISSFAQHLSLAISNDDISQFVLGETIILQNLGNTQIGWLWTLLNCSICPISISPLLFYSVTLCF